MNITMIKNKKKRYGFTPLFLKEIIPQKHSQLKWHGAFIL